MSSSDSLVWQLPKEVLDQFSGASLSSFRRKSILGFILGALVIVVWIGGRNLFPAWTLVLPVVIGLAILAVIVVRICAEKAVQRMNNLSMEMSSNGLRKTPGTLTPWESVVSWQVGTDPANGCDILEFRIESNGNEDCRKFPIDKSLLPSAIELAIRFAPEKRVE